MSDGLPRCIAPWVTKYYGVERWSCCTCLNDEGYIGMDFNSNQYRDLRLAFSKNEFDALPSNCRECATSPTSMADFYRQDFHKERYREVIGMFDTESGHMQDMRLTQFLVNISNKCNQACRMCHPENSDIVAAHRKSMGLSVNGSIKKRASGQFWTELKTQLPYLREISFHGGEPILNAETLEVLRLALPYKDSLNILFMTNGSTNRFVDGSSLEDWANKFPSFSVPYSIDGVPEVNEYIRKGANTAAAYKNLKALRKTAPHSRITIRHTTSNLNVARLPEFLETVNDLSGGAQDWIATDKVITPHIYSPSNLPPQLKKEAFQALAEYHAKAHDARFKELAKSNIRYLFDNEFNPSLWAEFKKENGIKDKFYEESPLLLRPLA